jgi:hypothetical protein
VRNYLVVLLLFCFGVLITPRTFWHSHDQISKAAVDNHLDQDHQHSDNTDCFACDYDLSLFTVQAVYVYSSFLQFSLPKVVGLSVFQERAFFTAFFLRGPPKLI